MAGDDRAIIKALRRLSGRAAARRAIDADMVARLRAHGFAASDQDGRLRITDTGRAFLRRDLADREVFAAQHRTLESAVVDRNEGGRQAVTVNAEESPLAWLRRRKGRDGRPLIDAAEFAAGERLRADYTRGLLMPRVTANWSAAVAQSRRDGAGGMADLTEAAIAARRRVEKALDAVGPDFAGVLVDFCCFLKGIEDIERERQWPRRSAKLVLRLALSGLARHYGLSATGRGPRHGGGIRHWGSDDFRPTIE